MVARSGLFGGLGPGLGASRGFGGVWRVGGVFFGAEDGVVVGWWFVVEAGCVEGGGISCSAVCCGK